VNQPLASPSSRSKLLWHQEDCQSSEEFDAQPKLGDERYEVVASAESPRSRCASPFRSRASTCCSTPRERDEEAYAGEEAALQAPVAVYRGSGPDARLYELSDAEGRRRSDTVRSFAWLLGGLVHSRREEEAAWNDFDAQGSDAFTCFNSMAPPELSLAEYLERLAKYFGCSDECFVFASVYLGRLMFLHPESFEITPFNAHKLAMMSVICAAKFWDDDVYDTKHYAYVGGIEPQELKALEARFLTLLGWSLNASPLEYDFHQERLSKLRGAAS